MPRMTAKPQPVEPLPGQTGRVQAIVTLLASAALFLTTAVMLTLMAAQGGETAFVLPLLTSLVPQSIVAARAVPPRRKRLL